jgi:hypothetical protein
MQDYRFAMRQLKIFLAEPLEEEYTLESLTEQARLCADRIRATIGSVRILSIDSFGVGVVVNDDDIPMLEQLLESEKLGAIEPDDEGEGISRIVASTEMSMGGRQAC